MPKYTLALVTGASSGIGEALCKLFADHGISLIITGRNQKHLEDLAEKLQTTVPVTVVVADLSVADDRRKIINLIHKSTPDLVINNAGFGFYGDAIDLPIKSQIEMVQVNVEAVVEISLESALAMKNKEMQGTILNVASAAAFPIFPGFAVYSATKAFVFSFSQSLDEEMRELNIRVLVSCPGRVHTHFQERAARGASRNKTAQMTVDYAAEQIWHQIEKKKAVHIFNWKYALAAFMIRYILPKRLLARFLRKYTHFK